MTRARRPKAVPESSRAQGEGFLRGHQLARILGIAVPLIMIAVWWGVWGSHGKVESVSETSGVIVRVEAHTCMVQVASGEQVRVFKPRNAREGMQVRMIRTEYRNGELRFDLVTRPSDSAEPITSSRP